MPTLPPPTIRSHDHDRFMSKVQKTDSCWIWIGNLNTTGYGIFKFGRQRYGAHRISYYLHHGKWPVGIICHHCDTPQCVNPDHLYDGTSQSNAIDAVVRNRLAKQAKKPRLTSPPLPFVHQLKPTVDKVPPEIIDQVLDRIEMRKELTDERIAEDFGLDAKVVRQIARRDFELFHSLEGPVVGYRLEQGHEHPRLGHREDITYGQ